MGYKLYWYIKTILLNAFLRWYQKCEQFIYSVNSIFTDLNKIGWVDLYAVIFFTKKDNAICLL